MNALPRDGAFPRGKRKKTGARRLNSALVPLPMNEERMNDRNDLIQALGYRFRSPELLRLALTHPSAGAVNNQRLEFLGDAVLQLVISRRLYLKYPELHEGMLTQMRQKLVCEGALAAVARNIGLGPCLKMDRGCEQTGGRAQDSVLSDAMESVLAAVYLEGGLDAATAVIDSLWPDAPKQTADAKSALQEFLQARGQEAPTYETIGEEGPAHARVFTVAVLIDGKEAAHGTEHSKKRAEQAAAREALKALCPRGGDTSCG